MDKAQSQGMNIPTGKKNYTEQEIAGIISQANFYHQKVEEAGKVIENLQMNNMFRRIDFLFAILNSEHFSTEVKERVSKEIINSVLEPEEDKDTKKEG